MSAKIFNTFFQRTGVSSFRILCTSVISSKTSIDNTVDVQSSEGDYDEVTLGDKTRELASNEKYARIKDLSRMKNWHRCLVHGQITPPNEFKWQQERWAKRQRYAQYGQASGVNPGIMWPTESELQEKIIEEDQWSPKLVDTIRAYKEKIEVQTEAEEERIKLIEINLKKYPSLMQEYLKKVEERRKVVNKAKEQRDARIKEIRDFFGYAIDESDPRFKAKLMMKQQEELTVSKLAKKKQRQAQMLEKLQSMTA